MNKHAYLIMAHGNWKILKVLLELLDDSRHDFYIHLDGRNGKVPNPLEWVKYSSVVVIESQPIYWADYSIVQVELNLLRRAKESGEPYTFFHLLSGADLPIKNRDDIYSFFERNTSFNFIGIVPNEVYYSVRRVKFYHLFTRTAAYRNSKLLKALDRGIELMQKALGVNRLKQKNIRIIDGWQWFSINPELCLYLLNNEKLIQSVFQKTISSDELFIQTLVYNNKSLYLSLYNTEDLKLGSMRFIDWKRGKPYVWGQEESDFETLMNSPYMFARKFDEKHFEIVERIFDCLSERNQHDK